MTTNKIRNLGLQLNEMAALLFVPESTLHTWFTRQSTIPPAYYGYISGLEIYQQQQKAEELQTVYTKWQTDNSALLEAQKSKAMRELRVFEQKNNLALEKLKLKETRLLRRLHLAGNYPKQLRADLQKSENLISWCNLIARRSAFDLGDIRLAVQKLEEKKAGLLAQMQYWEGDLN
jgi:hypothetical protein